MKITVLMSTYNGEKYIKEQLDSLLSQKLKPTKILIRDDGSSDSTVQIVKEYQKKNKCIELYVGENIKPARSFFNLINTCDKADYYALCDQDDVWFNDKLSRAIEVLEKQDNNIPQLYCSRFTLTDKDLNPINSKISSLYQYNDFSHALLYQSAPGCTFVFNDKAMQYIRRYDIENNYVMIHDSIIHKVVTMYGKMILDNESHIYYRQHGNNEIGLTGNKFKTFIGRINHFVSGRIKNTRSDVAKNLLSVYGKDCSKENKDLLNIVANYKTDIKLKRKLLLDERFKASGINYFFFRILVILNYI